MIDFDIIRAWKDEVYRQSLSKTQLAQVPLNPAGELQELSDSQLEEIEGGLLSQRLTTTTETNNTYFVGPEQRYTFCPSTILFENTMSLQLPPINLYSGVYQPVPF